MIRRKLSWVIVIRSRSNRSADTTAFATPVSSSSEMKTNPLAVPGRWRQMAEGVFDEEVLVRRTHELADFIEAAASRYGFDARCVVALGYSNGANIASSLLLLRPEILRGAVLLRAMASLAPHTPPDLAGRPIFLNGGRHDPLVPPENTQRPADLLRAAGAEVTLHWSEGDHQLTLPEIDAARAWMAAKFPL